MRINNIILMSINYVICISRLLMYPKNCHPISAVDAEADAAVNKAIWLLENL